MSQEHDRQENYERLKQEIEKEFNEKMEALGVIFPDLHRPNVELTPKGTALAEKLIKRRGRKKKDEKEAGGGGAI